MSIQIPDAVRVHDRIQALGWYVGAALVVVGAVAAMWIAPTQKVTYFESSATVEDSFNTALFITFVGLAAVVATVAAIGAQLARTIAAQQPPA